MDLTHHDTNMAKKKDMVKIDAAKAELSCFEAHQSDFFWLERHMLCFALYFWYMPSSVQFSGYKQDSKEASSFMYHVTETPSVSASCNVHNTFFVASRNQKTTG